MPAPKGHPPYPGCEKGGRSKRFSAEEIEKYAEDLLIWMKDESRFWLKDFCLEKSLDPDLMMQWSRENVKFAGAHKIAKSLQESRIFKGSIENAFNANMSKFALINNHGWADKTETKVSGDAVNPLSFILTLADGSSKDLIDDEDDDE